MKNFFIPGVLLITITQITLSRISGNMTIKYALRRRIIYTGGKFVQTLLSRTHVTGQENIPRSGPLIVVGNHSAFIEIVLMVLALPWPIELMGAGDIPLRQKFSFLQTMYGYIPINRGEIDRTALKAASDVLESGDGLGIFPEGGIWDRKVADARLGVAYLSQQTGTPILPMGFGGLIGATEKIVRLQRPRLTVNIGQVIPAVPTSQNYRERKSLAQKASNALMDAIYRLVPPDDEVNKAGGSTEQFDFEVQLTDSSGQTVQPPPELAIPNGAELALFFHRPLLIGVVIDNLKRPAEALRHLDTERNAGVLAASLGEALQVYVKEKPAFIGYRLGYARAGRIVAALQKLKELAEWAAAQHLNMRILPKLTVSYDDGRVEHFDSPGQPPAM